VLLYIITITIHKVAIKAVSDAAYVKDTQSVIRWAFWC